MTLEPLRTDLRASQESGVIHRDLWRWLNLLAQSVDVPKLTKAEQIIDCDAGASVAATGIIPDGAVPLIIESRVNEALGASSGTTGYQVGDGADADRWGTATGTAIGTVTGNADWTATTVQAFNAAQDIVLTANGGNFDGTGKIRVTVWYHKQQTAMGF